MEWQFRNDSPIYTQLTPAPGSQAIVAGEFRPGERLPSVRELAVEAGVNPNTVQRALADLERDGLVFSQRTPPSSSPPTSSRMSSRCSTRWIFLQNGRVERHTTVNAIRGETGKSVDELFREVFKC